MDGVQLPQGWSHFEEAVYFLQYAIVVNIILLNGNNNYTVFIHLSGVSFTSNLWNVVQVTL